MFKFIIGVCRRPMWSTGLFSETQICADWIVRCDIVTLGRDRCWQTSNIGLTIPGNFIWNPLQISCEIWQISINPLQISWNPPENLINQISQHKLFSFMECSGKAMSQDFMKSAGFHEICPDFVRSTWFYKNLEIWAFAWSPNIGLLKMKDQQSLINHLILEHSHKLDLIL